MGLDMQIVYLNPHPSYALLVQVMCGIHIQIITNWLKTPQLVYPQKAPLNGAFWVHS